MLNIENLRSVILEAVEKYLTETYNPENGVQVAVGLGSEDDEEDIVVDGGYQHGVFYISILSDSEVTGA